MYTTNTIPHVNGLAYGIYPLVVFVSEISLVRCAHSFDLLIQKQLVCKYRTPALSMKYSLCIYLSCCVFMSRFGSDLNQIRNG